MPRTERREPAAVAGKTRDLVLRLPPNAEKRYQERLRISKPRSVLRVFGPAFPEAPPFKNPESDLGAFRIESVRVIGKPEWRPTKRRGGEQGREP